MNKNALLGMMCSLFLCANSLAEGATYNKGTLNIKCSCSVIGSPERTEWHHMVKVPRDDHYIDFDHLCENTVSNYPDIQFLCSSDIKGIEYAFEQE